MARYQVVLVYDGTEFQGFQRQAKDSSISRTVQAVVEAVLQQLGWQDRSILVAGRTDTGVHASGQVIAFNLDWKHSVDELRAALNALLPMDVAARSVNPVKADFHPRYGALARRYRYRIYCQAVRDPLRDRFAWRVWPAVETNRMEQAARHLIGTHDFASFGTPPRSGGSTIRSVSQAGWYMEGADLVFEIVGNAFLYHMVRRLVFVLVAIGQRRLEPETISGCLEGSSQSIVQGLAPSQGLTLVEVIYPT